MQRRDEAYHQPDGNRGDQRADGFRVKAVAVPVFPFWRVIEQVVHGYLATLNQVEIGNQDTEQRTDKRPQHIRV